MSDQIDTVSDDGSLLGEIARPQTISLTSVGDENNSNESGKDKDSSPDKSDTPEKPILKQTDADIESSSEEAHEADYSTQVRPKTVTLKSTDKHKQRLVDMGAVSHHDDTKTDMDQDSQSEQVKRPYSPKPKSERCYICGKEFLLSSLKVHEKQCAKKLAKEKERQGVQETQNGRKSTINAQKGGGNFISKIPRKLKLEACYLCGKEFFSHSLGVHETQCIKNWKADKTPEANEKSIAEKGTHNLKRDENDHPEIEVQHDKKDHPTEDSASPSNNRSPKIEKKFDEGKQRVLKTIPCSMCGVQLLQHSLKIHEKKCRSRNEVIKESGDSSKNRDAQRSSKEDTNEPLEVLESPSISKKPRTTICYICGQEFLKSSYTVHEKQCASKSKAKSEQESTKKVNNPTTVRKHEAMAQGTNGTEVSGSSKELQSPSISKKPRTVICYICGLEFLKSSYAVHEKQCASKSKAKSEQESTKMVNNKGTTTVRKHEATAQGTNGTEVSGSSKELESPSISKKPRTVICYVCGQEFLKSSYAVHEKQCASKSKQESTKMTNDKGTPTIRKHEALAEGTPRKPKTQKCFLCGKEMLLSSLKIHEQQCQRKMEILKNINQQSPPAQKTQSTPRKAGAKPKTAVCYVCGEAFLSSSIKVHEVQCEKKSNSNRKAKA